MSSSVQQHSTADAYHGGHFRHNYHSRQCTCASILPPSSTQPPLPRSQFAELYSQSPKISITCDFVDFIFDSAANKPEDVDSLMKAAHLTYFNESLPTCYWASHRPKSTFREVFNVDFRDKISGHLTNPDTTDRAMFLNLSFIGGRARGLGLMEAPYITMVVREGLRFSNILGKNPTGEIAELLTLGACFQLLGSGSDLFSMHDGKTFQVEAVIKALE